MKYTETIITHEKLTSGVLCFWQMTGTIPASKSLQSRHLPKGQSLLIFNFGDFLNQPHSLLYPVPDSNIFIIPAVNTSSMVQQSGTINLFGISFIADGLYRLIGMAVTELNKGLNHELIEGLQILYRDLENISFQERCKVLEAFLLKHLNKKKESLVFNQAVKRINSARGVVKINKLSFDLKISNRQLQRLFKNRMGISPKDYCKIVRLNNYLEFILEKDQPIDWMDLVVEFDYHDQAHLIHEVKSLSKLSPQKLIDYRDTLYHHYN